VIAENGEVIGSHARLAIAGRDRTLSVPPIGRLDARREEDVGNVKATPSAVASVTNVRDARQFR
jgi:hypothetical protein